MVMPALGRVSVDRLFGFLHSSVQSLAGQGIQSDLALLHTLEKGLQPSPFSAEDVAHFQQVSDSYLRNHPLGFLAKNNPVIAQSMLQDALRRNVSTLMGAYNFANGHFKERDAAIAALHSVGSEHFVMAAQETMTEIHREVLVKAAKDMKGMAHTIDDDLWGTSAHDERAMKTQFEHPAQQLDKALALFDQGQTEAALALYAEVMGDADGTAAWFGRALRTSEKQKFSAHVGIAMAAGAAAYFTGGASLAFMGGQEAALGAHVTSMLIGGADMTVTSRVLNAAIFNETFFIPGTTLDKAVDFGGEVLHNTALMGVLKLGNIAGASLPMMEGEPVIAASINAARSFAIEFGSFTSFNLLSSVSNVVDDRYPSIDDTLSKDALLQNAAFILGLRIGHLGLNAAKFTARRALNAAIDLDSRLANFMRSQQMARFLLSPLVIFAGIPSGGGTPGSAVHDTFATLLQTLGTKPNVIDIYQRRPYKFWGILNLLDMGIPPALVAYRVLRLQVDEHSRAIMKEFRALLSDPQIKNAIRDIRERGMRSYLAENGISTSSDKFKNGADFMDRLALAYTQMQTYIDRYSAAAIEAGHMVGMEYEGKTHFGTYEEMIWPENESFMSPNVAGPSVRDRMVITLQGDLSKKGYEVDLLAGKPYFEYPEQPVIFPIIFEHYKIGDVEARMEILTGTGAIIITVIPNDPSMTKTKFVEGATTVFEANVHRKAAEMIAEALHLDVNNRNSEDVIASLRGQDGTFKRRYLIQAKAIDSDTLKIWVVINSDGTATLSPINGIFRNNAGHFIPGPIVISASNYEEVYAWLLKNTAKNPKFAKKADNYGGIAIAGFGEVTLTDEAPPYKEIVSPKLTRRNFTIWLDVLESLQEMGITGTTPYNLVGTHIHANLPLTLNVTAGSNFTIQPVLGILRGFVKDEDMMYDGIPSHDNRLAFIQPLPLWLKKRLMDPFYVTDPTSRYQILRVAADLARDIKKYNAMNLSNHISTLLAKMIENGVFRDVAHEIISVQWGGEDYKFRVGSDDIIRQVDSAVYILKVTNASFVITDRRIAEVWNAPNAVERLNNGILEFCEKEELAQLRLGEKKREGMVLESEEYELIATRTNADTIVVEIKKNIHLIRVAKNLRKTTAELRIFDAIFDRETGEFFLDFYYAWSWWHGSGIFYEQRQ